MCTAAFFIKQIIFIIRWMDKDVVYIYNRILLCHQKKWGFAIWQNMVGKYCSFFFFFFCRLLRATRLAYGGSKASSLIGAVAASLCPSYSNARPELHLQPTSQLTATLDP